MKFMLTRVPNDTTSLHGTTTVIVDRSRAQEAFDLFWDCSQNTGEDHCVTVKFWNIALSDDFVDKWDPLGTYSTGDDKPSKPFGLLEVTHAQ